ncbi:MAG TPA: DUF2029 domain-containing protein [Chloroflexi bacterium]|nr:DUF2029 domain-containing protein [Chloroflexota bacterium]
MSWLYRETTRRHLAVGLIILLIPLAAASLVRGVSKALGRPCDFQNFWVSGQLVAEGQNPYRVWLEDKPQLRERAIPPGTCSDLEDLPVFNPPLLPLMMIAFSGLDFLPARIIWLGLDIIMAILLPLLLMRLNPRPPSGQLQVISVLFFLTWLPVRYAISLSQTGLGAGFLAVLAVWLTYRERPRWLLAGLLMGAALIKYTLTGPLLLFFLIYRRYRVVAVAVLVQVLAFILFTLLVGDSLSEATHAYFALLFQATGQSSGVVSLDGWLNTVGLSSSASALIGLVASVVVTGLFIIPHYWHEALTPISDLSSPRGRLKGNLLITLLILVGLLFFYHRPYDLPLLFAFLAFAAGFDLPEDITTPRGRMIMILLISAVAVGLAMMLPGWWIGAAHPSLTVRDFFERFQFTVAGFLALAVSLWVLPRFDILMPPSGGQPDH